MTGLQEVGPGATGAGRTGAGRTGAEKEGACAGSVGVIGGTVGPSRGDGSVGRPTRRETTPGLDTPARGGRWPGEPGMIGARMRAFSVQECSPFDGALPAACTPGVPMCPGRCARAVSGRGCRRHRSALPPPRPLRGVVGRKGTVADGPLIVQSDKTLLLEVDHPRRCGGPRGDRSVRGARTRPRARPYLPRHPAGPVERAGRRARRRAGRRRARPRSPGSPSPSALLVDVVDTMGRYGRLHAHPVPSTAWSRRTGSGRAGGDPAAARIAPMLGARIDAGHRRRARRPSAVI